MNEEAPLVLPRAALVGLPLVYSLHAKERCDERGVNVYATIPRRATVYHEALIEGGVVRCWIVRRRVKLYVMHSWGCEHGLVVTVGKFGTKKSGRTLGFLKKSRN